MRAEYRTNDRFTRRGAPGYRKNDHSVSLNEVQNAVSELQTTHPAPDAGVPAGDGSDFATFGRFRETPVDRMPADTREAYEFTLRLRGMVPGPHRIWLANPTLSRTIVPTGAYFQRESTLTKAEIEIATNFVNGRWLAAYANHEHEKIGEVLGGLAPEKVQALITGMPTSFDDPRQQVVYELAWTLTAPRVVPTGLFQRARELLGDVGIVDVTVLLGWFTAVSLTLVAFDVPSNATGLHQ